MCKTLERAMAGDGPTAPGVLNLGVI